MTRRPRVQGSDAALVERPSASLPAGRPDDRGISVAGLMRRRPPRPRSTDRRKAGWRRAVGAGGSRTGGAIRYGMDGKMIDFRGPPRNRDPPVEEVILGTGPARHKLGSTRSNLPDPERRPAHAPTGTGTADREIHRDWLAETV